MSCLKGSHEVNLVIEIAGQIKSRLSHIVAAEDARRRMRGRSGTELALKERGNGGGNLSGAPDAVS